MTHRMTFLSEVSFNRTEEKAIRIPVRLGWRPPSAGGREVPNGAGGEVQMPFWT